MAATTFEAVYDATADDGAQIAFGLQSQAGDDAAIAIVIRLPDGTRTAAVLRGRHTIESLGHLFNLTAANWRRASEGFPLYPYTDNSGFELSHSEQIKRRV